MEYKVKAKTIGTLAEQFLRKNRTGRIKILLNETAYIDMRGHPVILTRKPERSPLTINLEPINTEPLRKLIGEQAEVSSEGNVLKAGEVNIYFANAEKHYTYPPSSRRISVTSEDLVKAGFLLSCFYQNEDRRNLLLIDTPQLGEFLRHVVFPYVNGRSRVIFEHEYYFTLLGLGRGFTPAGDDFLAGFLTTLNTYGSTFVSLPVEEILKLTSWASGMLLYYSHRGFYDESLSYLLKALTGECSLFDSLISMVRLGHTSGIDASLGVVIAAAMLVEKRRKDNTLERVLDKVNPSLVEYRV